LVFVVVAVVVVVALLSRGMRILMPPCPSSSSSSAMKNAFLYFAYGSNMLTERIRINSPTAVKKAVAKLEVSRTAGNLAG
jgi:hypothetical protein